MDWWTGGVPLQTVTDTLAAAASVACVRARAASARGGRLQGWEQLKSRIYTSIIGCLCLCQSIAKWNESGARGSVARARHCHKLKTAAFFNQSGIKRQPRLHGCDQ